MLNKKKIQCIAPSEFIRGELIGCFARVLDKNIEGRIVDESRNMIVVETADKKRKKIVKQNNAFEFVVNGKAVRIDGKSILARPEDRIRSKVRK